jgi:hypothetical protein
MRPLALVLAFLATVPVTNGVASPPPEARPTADAITAANLETHLRFLASEAMQGRETATPQFEIASDYAASILKLAGVEPAGDFLDADKKQRDYFQTFDVAEVTPVSQSLVLEVRDGETVTRRTYEANVDFTATGSVTIERTAPLVFAGYGFNVQDANWNDYEGLDLRGKIAVVLDGAPGYGNDASWFYKPENRRRYFGRFASIFKSSAAAEAGAAALVIVPNPRGESPFTRDLAENRPSRDSSFARNVRNLPARREMTLAGDEGGSIHGGFGGVPTVRVSERVSGHLFDGAADDAASIQKKIDDQMKPQRLDLPARRLTIDVKVDSRILVTRNVIGMISGSDPALTSEAVMIGAHLDHDGARGGYVWHGADDNGSGSAAVLEIARAFAANKVRPKRTLIFALWSGEEKGLLGSKWYVDHPTVAIDKTITYINLDMIGRDGDPASGGDPHGGPPKKPDPNAPKIDPTNWMSVEGSELYPALQTATESQNRTVGLTLTYKPGAIQFAASDHLHFARRGVPIISYFDGGHEDYHQPTDTVDKINFKKMEKVARLCYLTLLELANAASRPAKVEKPAGADAAKPGGGR